MLAIGARRHTRAPHRSRYGRRRATTRSRSRRDNAHPRSDDQNRVAPLAKCRRSAVVSLFGYDCRVNSIPTHHFKSVIRHGKQPQPQPPKGLEPPIDASRQSRSATLASERALRDGASGNMVCRHRQRLRREARRTNAARQLYGAPGAGTALGRLGHG